MNNFTSFFVVLKIKQAPNGIAYAKPTSQNWGLITVPVLPEMEP